MSNQRKTTPAGNELMKPYEPTPFERTTLDACRARNQEKPFPPRMKVLQKGGVVTLAPNHPEPAIAHARLAAALGTRDGDFLNGLLKQLCSVGSKGRAIDEEGLNFMLSMVQGLEPRDQVETMLAAQMSAVHNATMTFARRLAHVENIPQQAARSGRSISWRGPSLPRWRRSSDTGLPVKPSGWSTSR